MVKIHPTAIVSPKAELDDEVEIAAYSIVEDEVQIGRGTTVGPHVQICQFTQIGQECQIYFGCSIGNPSKDLKHGGWRLFVL
mgnify:FL=1